MSGDAFPRAVAGIVGALFFAFGLWAFLAPQSFFDRIAAFPPYNVHLVHDLGAFQAGIGAVLLLALVFSDALLAALAGAGVGFILHVFGHVIDASKGGKPTDPFAVAAVMLVTVVAALLRARSQRS